MNVDSALACYWMSPRLRMLCLSDQAAAAGHKWQETSLSPWPAIGAFNWKMSFLCVTTITPPSNNVRPKWPVTCIGHWVTRESASPLLVLSCLDRSSLKLYRGCWGHYTKHVIVGCISVVQVSCGPIKMVNYGRRWWEQRRRVRVVSRHRVVRGLLYWKEL